MYDDFASFPYTPRPLDVIASRFALEGKTVADLGAGSGRSSFILAEHGANVIGIEPEDAMRSLAETDAERRGVVDRVSFLKGSHEAIPLADRSVDALTAITAPVDVPEALRVVRPGGVVIALGIPPGWYGGDLNAVIENMIFDTETHERQVSEGFVRAGFSFFDFDSVQEYGTVDNIVQTYGFMFGRKVIANLRETERTSVRWRFRVHHMSA